MICKGVPLAGSHRHTRICYHWVSLQQLWHGYSYAASSMYSVMDEAEKALDFLTFFTDLKVVADCRMTVNTMYREGKNLALESPLSAAQSMLDMVVQSHEGW
ncbi:hypothetical protein GCM10015535_06830 [Streptomyces gelaticus]|uniref:Uncharacterized protein n=1 Tax=Streptomyces gelaticus TaxID=285446 RepID=A0ABQ2VU00_9ACTN|nr:hypothetical protein [Streptomyces gelaticus]GGV75930.1 hypothetical protein GCM10015535_06830 [Streptomyces gelaticus]